MKFYIHYKATPAAPENLSRYNGARAGFVIAKNEVAAQVKANRWFKESGERADSFYRNGFEVTVQPA